MDRVARRVVGLSLGLLLIVGPWPKPLAVEQHDHTGILTPYQGAPPEVELSPDQRETLEGGEPLLGHVRVDGENRVYAVIRVNASPATVWSVLRDFPTYPDWVDGLEASEIYRQDGDDIHVTFVWRQWLIGDVTYHVRHTYPGEVAGWGTWTLDYSRRSDLDDTVGFWRVEPVDGDPDRADVVYSTRVRLRGFLLRWVADWLVEDTLQSVATGLKQRAEWKRVASQP